MKLFIWLLAFGSSSFQIQAAVSPATATNLATSFPLGTGSSYKLIGKNLPSVIISIYVAAVTEKSVSLEYFMESRDGLLPIQLWQQFEIQVGTANKVQNGYIFAKEFKAPEKMPAEYLQGADGVQVNDFLFSDKSTLDKNKVGEETLSLPAGQAIATHYRSTNNGQQVDYWISDSAKPIGLVKLESKGPKITHNYSLDLVSLMSHVKANIDPSKAGPLTELGKTYLARPSTVR